MFWKITFRQEIGRPIRPHDAIIHLKLNIMAKEMLADIYLREFGVEEMIDFVCSLTDDEIENLSL